MKKSYVLALLLSAFTVSSFAQDAAAIGARRVAERDAAYAQSHSAEPQRMAPVVHHAKKHPVAKHHAKKHAVRHTAAKKLTK